VLRAKRTGTTSYINIIKNSFQSLHVIVQKNTNTESRGLRFAGVVSN